MKNIREWHLFFLMTLRYQWKVNEDIMLQEYTSYSYLNIKKIIIKIDFLIKKYEDDILTQYADSDNLEWVDDFDDFDDFGVIKN